MNRVRYLTTIRCVKIIVIELKLKGASSTCIWHCRRRFGLPPSFNSINFKTIRAKFSSKRKTREVLNMVFKMEAQIIKIAQVSLNRLPLASRFSGCTLAITSFKGVWFTNFYEELSSYSKNDAVFERAKILQKFRCSAFPACEDDFLEISSI